VLPVELWPYAPLAERVWELRENITSYDASYVALAELLDTTLVTIDGRLAKAPGPRCRIEAYSP
jgi:predicted nucleic acid-binding protein